MTSSILFYSLLERIVLPLCRHTASNSSKSRIWMERCLLYKTCSSTLEELTAEMQGTVINGHDFALHDTSSVVEICGDIGTVYPPCDYAAWPHSRIYSMHYRGDVNRSASACVCTGASASSSSDLNTSPSLIGYAAVRFKSKGRHKETATFVIDSFGISEKIRCKGAGRHFFNYIKQDIATAGWRNALVENGHLASNESYTISLQSTFDYNSYVAALAAHTIEHKIASSPSPSTFGEVSPPPPSRMAFSPPSYTDTMHKVTIDMAAVLKKVHGSCDFWRRMGFNKEKIVCTGPFSIIQPVIMMWQKI